MYYVWGGPTLPAKTAGTLFHTNSIMYLVPIVFLILVLAVVVIMLILTQCEFNHITPRILSPIQEKIYPANPPKSGPRNRHSSLGTNKSVNNQKPTGSFNPLRDFHYKIDEHNEDDRSVLVVPRRAYYDQRTVEGAPRNILVILTEVEESLVKSILACEINGHHSVTIATIKESTTWLRAHRPGHTHCLVTVQCMGLPKDIITNGSITKIIYKRTGDTFYSRVQTEKPLFITTPPAKKGSVFTCTTLFGHPDRFEPWLKYQKAIGVDMVRLNVHSSFSENATVLYPYLKEAIDSGFVEMETWIDITGNRFYYHSKIVKYQDCLYRYMDTFEYAMYFDHDDFLNPVIPKQKDVHFYFDHLFAKEKMGTAFFRWRQMECAPIQKAMGNLPDGNLTSILSGNKTRWRNEKKCAHRLSALQYVSIHSGHKLLPGYTRSTVMKTMVYVAHVRHTMKPCS